MQENAENAVRKSAVGQAAFGQINSGLSFLANNLLVIEAQDGQAGTSGAGSAAADAEKPTVEGAQGEGRGGDDELLDISLDDTPTRSITTSSEPISMGEMSKSTKGTGK